MKQHIKQSISWLQNLSGLTLFACLPMFFNGVTRISMLMFIVLSLVDYVINKRYKDAHFFTLQKAPFWACIAVYALLLAYTPFEKHPDYLPVFTESRLAFLVFGILGVLGTQVPRAKHVAYIGIVVSVALIIYTLYLSYTITPDEGMDWKRHIIMTRHSHIHAHMAFNMFLNVTIAACFWLIKQHKQRVYQIIYIALIALFYGAVAFSDGRMGFISCNIIVIMGIAYLLGEKHKKATLLLLLGCIVVGCFIILSNRKVEKLLSSQHEIRHDIWSESIALIQQDPIIGVGASTNVYRLIETFKASESIQQDRAFINACTNTDVSGAHPHNQLMQSIMENGLLGLLCMMTILIVPLVYSIKNKSNMMVIACCCIIVVQLQTEVIRGSLGDYAFCLYLLFAMHYAQQSSKKVVGSMQGHDQLPSAAR